MTFNNESTPEPKLLQLEYRNEPWKMMVVCILLNQTQRAQVDRVIDALFCEYPTPEHLARADLSDLRELLYPLGLSRMRSIRVLRFADDWSAGTPVEDCYGIGDYAYDSYRLFVLGDTDVSPHDKELRRWIAWKKSLQK